MTALYPKSGVTFQAMRLENGQNVRFKDRLFVGLRVVQRNIRAEQATRN
jgi:hypothetical protein